MRSGKYVSVDINLIEYDDLHSSECKSRKFKDQLIKNSVMNSSTLGPIQMPLIPMLVCSDCGAAFVMPGFEAWVEEMLARGFVAQNGVLSKKQLRFLRQHFELTQEQVATLTGVPDRHEISKMESSTSDRTMDLDKQLRLKLHYAERLHFEDINELFKIATPLDKPIEIDPSWISADAIKKQFKLG